MVRPKNRTPKRVAEILELHNRTSLSTGVVCREGVCLKALSGYL